MKLVTGSRLPILQHCQWWARDDVSYTKPESGAAAGRGVDMHDAIDKRDLTGVAFEDLQAVQRGISYLDSLRAAGWAIETEVPLALNYVTGEGRRLKSSGHRDYSDLKPDEIGLTVDYIAVYSSATEHKIEVGDWKTGYGSHVDRASENWQLGAAAAALSEMGNDAPVMAAIHYLDSDRVDSWMFSAMEAQRFGIWIRNRVELTPHAQPSPGDHCRYCDARVQCPKTQTALQALVPEPVRWTLERLGEDNDRAMVRALPALEAAVEAVKKSLKAAYPSGIDLGTGKTWKPVLSSRSGYDTKRMVEALGPRAEEFRTKTEYEQWRQVKS